MEVNYGILALAALVPMVIGFIWYHPKVMGTAWMNASGMTEEKMKGGNMPLIFGLSYVLSFLAAFAIQYMVIHQNHLLSIIYGEPGVVEKSGEAWGWMQAALATYGDNWRTFSHGMLHGVLVGFFFVLPIMATNAMFERKGFKYIAVNVGYWIITIGLMGGIICQWA